ncbi:MAG: hypothetical protein NTY48_03920 [Candidatus Diapherotrites archaeon]|nr:hypothetical protein [Candidatus Diapherotrites archaeon]
MKIRNYNQNQRALAVIEKFDTRRLTRYRFASYVCGIGQERINGLRKQLFLKILNTTLEQKYCYKKDLLNYDSKNLITNATISKKTLRQIIDKINREAKTDLICYYDEKPTGKRTPKRGYYISLFDLAFMGEDRLKTLKKDFLEKQFGGSTEKALTKIVRSSNIKTCIKSINSVLDEGNAKRMVNLPKMQTFNIDAKQYMAYELATSLDYLQSAFQSKFKIKTIDVFL